MTEIIAVAILLPIFIVTLILLYIAVTMEGR
jgi:hypothetical protein